MKLFLSFALLIVTHISLAGTVTGFLFEYHTDKPLKDAWVRIIGNETIIAHTDSMGQFTIEIPNDSIIHLSFGGVSQHRLAFINLHTKEKEVINLGGIPLVTFPKIEMHLDDGTVETTVLGDTTKPIPSSITGHARYGWVCFYDIDLVRNLKQLGDVFSEKIKNYDAEMLKFYRTKHDVLYVTDYVPLKGSCDLKVR
jgi:hypothetical protein